MTARPRARTVQQPGEPVLDGSGAGSGMPAADTPRDDAAHGDGATRVALAFEPAGRKVRVPPGVTLFDAASWNGIAIDSTCGGHGTCAKCKIKVLDGAVPVTVARHTAPSPPSSSRGGWRLACRALAVSDLTVEVPPLVTRPKAATVGVGGR